MLGSGASVWRFPTEAIAPHPFSSALAISEADRDATHLRFLRTRTPRESRGTSAGRPGTIFDPSDLGNARGVLQRGPDVRRRARNGAVTMLAAATFYDEAMRVVGSSTACTNLGFLYGEPGGASRRTQAERWGSTSGDATVPAASPSNLTRLQVNVGEGLPRRPRLCRGTKSGRRRCSGRQCDRSPDADDSRSRRESLARLLPPGALYLAGDDAQRRTTSPKGVVRARLRAGRRVRLLQRGGRLCERRRASTRIPRGPRNSLDRACELGDAEGCYDLGIAYERATASPRTEAAPCRSFGRACELGFKAACARRSRSGSGRGHARGRGTAAESSRLAEERPDDRVARSRSDGSPDGDSAGVPSEIPGVA